MNARSLLILLLACVTWFGSHAPAALAADPAKSFSVHAFGSYQSYAMDDVNANMQVALASFPGSTADKDKIDSGEGTIQGHTRGWGIGLHLKDAVGFSYDRATVPQSVFLVPVHRKALTFYFNPIRAWEYVRGTRARV